LPRTVYNLKRDAVFCASRSGSVVGVALSNESNLDALSCRALNVFGDPALRWPKTAGPASKEMI
jgi:hypothetical protein